MIDMIENPHELAHMLEMIIENQQAIIIYLDILKSVVATGIGLTVGAVAGGVFISKWNMGI